MAEPADPRGAKRTSLYERILGSLPGLTSFVRRRMGPGLASRESASDIVQSTCRELLRGASSFEDRGEASFQRWLQTAAEHKLQNRARHWNAQRRQGRALSIDADGARDNHQARGALEPAAPASSHPSQEALLREEAERLARAFRALPDDYRVVLVRSQIDGASPAELALELDRSPAAVRKLIARAMSLFSAELEPTADSPGPSEPSRTPGAPGLPGQDRTPLEEDQSDGSAHAGRTPIQ